jgi:photosystem II stability/assembly factor-like uncharacterized protein
MRTDTGLRARGVTAPVAALLLCGCQGGTGQSTATVAATADVQRYEIVQAMAASGQRIVAGTQTGVLLSSADGGATWTRHSVGPHSFVSVAACPDGSFFAADFYHHVVPVDAQGVPGKPLPLEKPETPLATACDGAGRWWIVGTFATVAVSADRGASWQVQDLGEDAHLTAIQFVDATNAVMAGEFGLLFSSSDGGVTWTRGPAIPNEFYPYTAHFNGTGEGWLAGIAGQVLRTTDAGATWVREPNTSGFAFYKIFAVGGRLYGVGSGGVAERGADGTWTAIPPEASLPAFLSAAAAVGDEGSQTTAVVGGLGATQLVRLTAG